MPIANWEFRIEGREGAMEMDGDKAHCCFFSSAQSQMVLWAEVVVASESLIEDWNHRRLTTAKIQLDYEEDRVGFRFIQGQLVAFSSLLFSYSGITLYGLQSQSGCQHFQKLLLGETPHPQQPTGQPPMRVGAG